MMQAMDTQRITPTLTASLDEPLYYLHNFETVVHWVLERYADLLDDDECKSLRKFLLLPQKSRALFVRMVMRKGTLFRVSKLQYHEIGKTRAALQALITGDWVLHDPDLSLDELFSVLNKDDLSAIFEELPRHGRKTEWLDAIAETYADTRAFSQWCGALDDMVIAIRDPLLFERVRLLFFGNLHQDWSEFVLAELGIYQYEVVSFTLQDRAFTSRCDIEHYERIYACRAELDAENINANELRATLQTIDSVNPWIMRRRAKVLFKLGQRCEKLAEWETALAIYQQCNYPGARVRSIRVQEQLQCFDQALALCEQALGAPESEAEHQQLRRMLPRLRRKNGTPSVKRLPEISYSEIELTLPFPKMPCSVEVAVQQLLHCDEGPVYYVENTLINSLFGLLCWDAIFTSVSGAFFHPFQAGPADLLHPDFYALRKSHFDRIFEQLETNLYRQTIRQQFQRKQWIQSPFVHWSALSEELLDIALECFPAEHLRLLFTRLLQDIKTNRSGLPDLIQFWPREQRYQMIEVKGPGDRLQDNQKRWLDYCLVHTIPVAVCYVQWQS